MLTFRSLAIPAKSSVTASSGHGLTNEMNAPCLSAVSVKAWWFCASSSSAKRSASATAEARDPLLNAIAAIAISDLLGIDATYTSTSLAMPSSLFTVLPHSHRADCAIISKTAPFTKSILTTNYESAAANAIQSDSSQTTGCHFYADDTAPYSQPNTLLILVCMQPPTPFLRTD